MDEIETIEFTHKTLGGMVFTHAAYAYVPDRDQPAGWQFRIWETPELKTTKAQVTVAVKEFAAAKGNLPSVDLPKVKARLLAAWRRVNPGAPNPAVLSMDEDELPQVVDIPDVELFATGTWKQRTFTEGDLDDMVDAYYELEHMSRPVILGHDPYQPILSGSGLPAAGWVENLRRVEGTLVGDLKGVPSKVASLIKLGAFRKRSSEIYVNYTDTVTGKVFPYVFKALALLGAAIPEVKTINDIYSLYDIEEGELEVFETVVNEQSSSDQQPTTTPVEEEAGATSEVPEQDSNGGVAMNEETRKALLETLELSEDASDEDILAAAKKLRETPAPAETVAHSEDVIGVFKASEEYLGLVADATAGREASKKVFEMERDNAIAKGMREGKITPATKDAWLARYEKDPQMSVDILNEMAPIVTFGESGTETDPSTPTTIDPNKVSEEVHQYQEDHPNVGLEDAYMAVLKKYGEV